MKREQVDTLSKQAAASQASEPKMVYWHRELPPLGAEAIGEHVVEAASAHVRGSLDHGSELWDRCYKNLMTEAAGRLKQEVYRLGGDYAHVLNEYVDAKRDDARGQSWLHGEFTYMLYRESQEKHSSS